MSRDDLESRTRACRSCGAQITMIKGPTGKYIPAQKVTQLYTLPPSLPGVTTEPQLELVSRRETWISHFQTCPAAAAHSRGS